MLWGKSNGRRKHPASSENELFRADAKVEDSINVEARQSNKSKRHSIPWLAQKLRFKNKILIVLLISAVTILVYFTPLHFRAYIDAATPKLFSNNDTLGCETPSLPRRSMHIVVASYKYNQDDAGIDFDNNNMYLWDLRLTNADIYWYRRVEPHMPLREQVDGPCGMTLNERLLLPNYGREGAAFVDHVLEFYDDPPTSIVFLHGHAAVGWHTSCQAVFARTTYVYRQLARSFAADFDLQRNGDRNSTKNHMDKTADSHMMTLTSDIHGTTNFDPFKWYGVNRTNAPRVPQEVMLADEIGKQQQSPCWKFKQRWNLTTTTTKKSQPTFMSCCASFILPGHRIRRFPRTFYRDLQSVLLDTTQPDQGRGCFEYVVYKWFGDDPEVSFDPDELRQFYTQADGMVNGIISGDTKNLATSHVDEILLERMKQCKAASKETVKRYEQKQKWKNEWKRFDGAH